ncbi:PEP-CTERM sorting domain-containing protein [Isosphaeraceae bacterium EP7]
MRTRIYSTGLLCLAMIATASSARSEAIGISFYGSLYDIDLATGAATNLRNTGLQSVVGVALRADGALFTMTTFGDNIPSTLMRIDPLTGAATVIGAVGLDIREGDLGFDPSTQELFGLFNLGSGGTQSLLRLDADTGQATVIGVVPGGVDDMSGLTFDASGNLLVLETRISTDGDSRLLTLDKSTGAILSALTLDRQLGVVGGLSYDGLSGNLYLVEGNFGSSDPNSLYTVDRTTGGLTAVGPTGLSTEGLAGLTITPFAVAVPEPASVVLLGLGVAGLGVRLLRQPHRRAMTR